MENFELATRTAMSNTAVCVVDVTGVLDIKTVVKFEILFQELIKKRQFKIVLNLAKLTYISSAGIGVLMSIIKDIRRNRGDIKIVGLSPEINSVFDLLELPGLFHILETEREAAAEF